MDELANRITGFADYGCCMCRLAGHEDGHLQPFASEPRTLAGRVVEVHYAADLVKFCRSFLLGARGLE